MVRFNRVKGALSSLPSTLQALLQAKVSLDRLTAYMNQPEIDPPCEDSGGRIICDHATVGWPVCDEADQPKNTTVFTLKDLHFEPPQGKMTIVCGSLGSGKTLLVSHPVPERRCMLTTSFVDYSVRLVCLRARSSPQEPLRMLYPSMAVRYTGIGQPSRGSSTLSRMPLNKLLSATARFETTFASVSRSGKTDTRRL